MKKEKLYKCSNCGICKKDTEIFYYIDGNNIAITKNSPPLCFDCYIKRYGNKNASRSVSGKEAL